MKKRLISALCLLFALVLLLSSCAAGLPGHELVTAIKNGVGGFSSNLKNLLEKNAPIVLDGQSDFTVIFNAKESDLLKSAIKDFCGAVEEKTGVALPTNKTLGVKRRILIGSTGDEASVMAARWLNKASFYIGFSGKDLVVQAKNDVMLISALHYLENTYLTAEDANAGEGYFFLPGDLDFTAPTVTITEDNEEDFSLVRKETLNEADIALITSFYEKISQASGLHLKMKTDLVEIKEAALAKEILVGTPAREEAKAMNEKLAFDEYYLGTQGNKLLVLGQNPYLLEMAINTFCSTFLQMDGSSADSEAKTLTLPTLLSFHFKQNHHLLADGGKSNMMLVYADSLGRTALDAINDFVIYFEKLTNAPLAVYSESERPENTDGAFELLVGPTKRPDSVLLTRPMFAGQWTVAAKENALLVAALGDNSTILALRALQDRLLGWVDLFTSNELYGWTEHGWGLVPYVDHLLAVPATLELRGTAAPDLSPLTSRTDLPNGSYVLYRENASEATFSDYIANLMRLGYEEKQRDEGGKLSTIVMASNHLLLTVSYATDTKLLRVVADPVSTTPAPQGSTSTTLSGKTNIAPLYAQLLGTSRSIYASSNFGMSTVVRLRDGSFIIINGGNGNDTNAKELLQYLKDHNSLPGKPIIACWIFTDGSSPAMGTFNAFAKKYAGEVSLHSVMQNFPTREQTMLNGGNAVANAQDNFQGNVKRFGNNVKIYRARSGASYCFAGCRIDILLTLEDFPIGYQLENYDDCSLVFRMTLSDAQSNSKTFMMLGNVSRMGTQLLLSRYGNALKSDAVQIPTRSGHVNKSATAELYAAIAAPVVFWPVAYKHASKSTLFYGDASFDTTTRTMLQQAYAKSCFVACRGNVTLTFAELNAAIEGNPKAPGLKAADAAIGTTID